MAVCRKFGCADPKLSQLPACQAVQPKEASIAPQGSRPYDPCSRKSGLCDVAQHLGHRVAQHLGHRDVAQILAIVMLRSLLAMVKKPTGLLSVRLPYFMRSTNNRVLEGATMPTEVAIGVDGHGQFKTAEYAEYKAYPAKFCEGLAGSICDQLSVDHEAHEATSTIGKGAGPLPDFQG